MARSDLAHLFEFLAQQHREHAPGSPLHKCLAPLLDGVFRSMTELCLQSRPMLLGELGPIVLPYQPMGAIDSLHLFGLDELFLFAYYWRSRGRYRRALDIGANLGLHSIILAKCGVAVAAYEPDPTHYATLCANLALNEVAAACEAHQAAVSDHTGAMTFVRVLGNTTSSHLAGSKPNAYGPMERFTVATCDIRDVCDGIDFAKIDAEAHEAVILLAIPIDRWQSLDAVVEVGTPDNAEAIFRHFDGSPVRIFAQRRGWQRVDRLAEMPTSYRDGSIFLSVSERMDW